MAETAEQREDRIIGWLEQQATDAHGLFLHAATKGARETHWRRYTVLRATAYRLRQGEHLAPAGASTEGSREP